jgi:hypothetical protein
MVAFVSKERIAFILRFKQSFRNVGNCLPVDMTQVVPRLIQTVSRWSVSEEVRVRSQTSPCGTWGGKINILKGFASSRLIFPVRIIPRALDCSLCFYQTARRLWTEPSSVACPFAEHKQIDLRNNIRRKLHKKCHKNIHRCNRSVEAIKLVSYAFTALSRANVDMFVRKPPIFFCVHAD